MSRLTEVPQIRIRIEPFEGFRNKWKFTVEQLFNGGKHGDWWGMAWKWNSPGVRGLRGYARTEEACRRKARAAAADHCVTLQKEVARNLAHNGATSIEKVTCEGGL